MAELAINKTPFGWESDVVTDKINAIQVVFAENGTHKLSIAISVDGENYVSNGTYTISEKQFCVVVGDDVDGLSKKVITNEEPVSINYL